MKKHWQYFKHVVRHKWFVFQECLKAGVPIWIAIFHDYDKFLPDEWFPYANYFYGNLPTRDECRTAFMLGISVYTQEDCERDFANAWMKHQHRNKHHWQYWCKVENISLINANAMIWDKGNAQAFVQRDAGYGQFWYEVIDIDSKLINCDPMPDVYRREMLADWRGAGRAITGKDNTLDWYIDNYYNIKLHPDTRLWIDRQLVFGEDSTLMTMGAEAQLENCSVQDWRDY